MKSKNSLTLDDISKLLDSKLEKIIDYIDKEQSRKENIINLLKTRSQNEKHSVVKLLRRKIGNKISYGI